MVKICQTEEDTSQKNQSKYNVLEMVNTQVKICMDPLQEFKNNYIIFREY